MRKLFTTMRFLQSIMLISVSTMLATTLNIKVVPGQLSYVWILFAKSCLFGHCKQDLKVVN